MRPHDAANRAVLSELSAECDASDAARVACWVAVMCWGAGPRNNHRLRQWTQALDPSLGGQLKRSRTDLLEDRPADAYWHAKMLGVGEAFLTKWLWAIGLSQPDLKPATPAVLDSRVWNTLARLGWWPVGRNKGYRWADYCAALTRWSDLLNSAEPGWSVDSDRLEQLLFDRNGQDTPSFFTWLKQMTEQR